MVRHVKLAALVVFSISSLAQAAPIRLDVDGFGAPASETEPGFTRMTAPGMLGDAMNGVFKPTATVDGVTVTARGKQPNGSDAVVPYRDRGPVPGTANRQRNLERDFIGLDQGNIEIAISGLVAGTYRVTTYHVDWNIDSNVNLFDILVTDALGAARLVANNVDTPSSASDYFGVSYLVATRGEALFIELDFESGPNGTRFNGIELTQIPAPATAALMMLGIAGFGFRRRRYPG